MSVLLDSLSLATEEILGCQKTFHPNRSSSMQSTGGDPHLCSQTIPEAVTESGGCVHVYARAVHPSQEVFPDCNVLCITVCQ